MGQFIDVFSRLGTALHRHKPAQRSAKCRRNASGYWRSSRLERLEERALLSYSGTHVSTTATSPITLGQDLSLVTTVTNTGTDTWTEWDYPSWIVRAENLSWNPGLTMTKYFYDDVSSGQTKSDPWTMYASSLPSSTGSYSFTVRAAPIDQDTGIIKFSTMTGNPKTINFTINQAVTVGVAVSPTSATENGTTNLAYTFTRTGSTTSAMTVNFNVAGTATFTTDYTQSGAATFSGTVGTVTIPAGSSTATVIVDPAADNTVEPNETVLLTVAAGTGYTVGSPSNATGTITNDDVANVTITDVTQAEGSPSGTTAFAFTVSLSNPVASNVTVDYATANGTATTADGDYTAGSGTVTFTAGGALTQTVTANVTKDSKVEANETFLVNLTNARFGGSVDATRAAITDAQATGTITNDDVANVTITDVTQAEGSPSGTTAFAFTVSLSNPVASNVTVDYATANGTATTADGDYTAGSGTATFTAGGALTQTVTANVTKDSKVEANETFLVNLTNARFGGSVDATRAAITDAQATGTITNDDWIPGDANRNGTVDSNDAGILATHWGKSGMGWTDGDFNNDGRVNAADAAILAANWGATGGLPSEGSEPVSVGPVCSDSSQLVGPVPAISRGVRQPLSALIRARQPNAAAPTSLRTMTQSTSPSAERSVTLFVEMPVAASETLAASDAVLAGQPDSAWDLQQHAFDWASTIARRQLRRAGSGAVDRTALAIDSLLSAPSTLS